MATAPLLHHIPFNACYPNHSSGKSHFPRSSTITCSTTTPEVLSAKRHLLNLISDQERGLRTQKDPIKRSEIVEAIDAMGVLGRDMVTTSDSLSATWRLLWTTEKEQLFIIEKAPLLGTQAGDVLQVIDVEKRILNNVITFPPSGVFFVRSTIEIASSQRVNFRYAFVSPWLWFHIPFGYWENGRNERKMILGMSYSSWVMKKYWVKMEGKKKMSPIFCFADGEKRRKKGGFF